METQPSFDLNLAIQRWRQNLADSPAFRRENVSELESHLRDSVATLQTRGLSAEESFLIATRRIGSSTQLASEFGKLNRGNVWLGRAMWMLIGIQVWPIFDRLMSSIAGNVFALGWRNVHPARHVVGDAWPVLFSALIQLPALIAAVWLCWSVLRKSGKLGQWVATKLSQRSSFGLCCIAACVLSILLYTLGGVLQWALFKFSGGQFATISYVENSRMYILPLRLISFAVLTLLLARKQFVPEKA